MATTTPRPKLTKSEDGDDARDDIYWSQAVENACVERVGSSDSSHIRFGKEVNDFAVKIKAVPGDKTSPFQAVPSFELGLITTTRSDVAARGRPFYFFILKIAPS